MFKIITMQSVALESQDAVQEILSSASERLDGVRPQACLVYAGINYEAKEILYELSAAYPDMVMVGCSSDGEASSDHGYEEESLLVTFFVSDSISFATGIGHGLSQDPKLATDQAVAAARASLSDEPCLCLVFFESIKTNGVAAIREMQATLGEACALVGGASTDRSKFEKTLQFYDGEVHSDAVVVLLCAGPLALSHGVETGWVPVGREGIVTAVDGINVLTIDDIPALDFYNIYLGQTVADYPLSVKDERSGRCYLRAPTGNDPTTGSVSFFGEVPLGARVTLSRGVNDEIIAASKKSIQSAFDAFEGSSISGAFFVSCVSRRHALGLRTVEEFKEMVASLGADVPVCGYYANGEVGPLANAQPSIFHNETFVTLILGER